VTAPSSTSPAPFGNRLLICFLAIFLTCFFSSLSSLAVVATSATAVPASAAPDRRAAPDARPTCSISLVVPTTTPEQAASATPAAGFHFLGPTGPLGRFLGLSLGPLGLLFGFGLFPTGPRSPLLRL
jgi:hypothetical protein